MFGLALAIFAVPARFEGPTLLTVSAGHAIAVVDAIAVAVLIVAMLMIYYGLWTGRYALGAVARRSPGRAGALAFASGTGLGLLIASAFSAYFWWWAIGAFVFAVTLAWAGIQVWRGMPDN